LSGSGLFGSVAQSKRELAAEIASVLAFSAIRNNDKVGLILFSEGVEKFIPPRKGRKHVLRVIREILFYEPKKRGTDLNSELELPALGRLVLKDAETGEVVEVNTGDERKRAAFAQRQARAQAELLKLFRGARIDSIQLRTDQPYAGALGRFFETREKRRRHG